MPDGPPTVFNISANSSQSILVKLEVPAPDVVNGIIRGYHVFYSRADKNGNVTGHEMMIDVIRGNEDITIGLIEGLDEFTLYRLTARAYTSIGAGPNTTITRLVRTLEDGMKTIHILYVISLTSL